MRVGLSLASLLAATAFVTAAGATPVAPHAPGRLIVKYRGVDGCVDCRLRRGEPMGDEALDALHRRFDVRSARGLFVGDERDRRAAWAQRVNTARARTRHRAAPGSRPVPDLSQVYVLTVPDHTDVLEAARAYAESPHVVYAHPDYEVRASLVPNDPLFGSLYAMPLIEAPLAWDTATGGGVVIAVIDTGIDRAHPDLAANVWTNPGEVPGNGIDDDANGKIDDLIGWDFVADDAEPEDHHGHGTHVAGTAAAVGNNALGVVGVGFGSRVMGVKGLNDQGVGFISDLAPAVVYAAETGADVLNNSWGGFGISDALVDAVDAARALGAVVVAAAGNESSLADLRQPAGIPGVIAAGASDSSDTIASFSNHGEVLSVAAPGVGILSLRADGASGIGSSGIVDGTYQRLSGTSMAAPHVAGLATVLLSADPTLHPDEVRWHLELNADQPGYPGWEGEPWNPFFGWGRINAARVFDPPPVTTRLTRTPLALHGIVDATTAMATFVDVDFTTLTPPAWTLSAPSWLLPSSGGDVGPARVTFDFDGTGLVPGELSGPISVDAPATDDGGASVAATAFVHRDERIGPAVTLAEDVFIGGGPRTVSDGVGTAIVRTQLGDLVLTVLDGAGTVVRESTLDTARVPNAPAIAFDGRGYLIVFIEHDDNRDRVKGVRATADGQFVDAQPFLIEEAKVTPSRGLFGTQVGFDGDAFTVAWGWVDSRSDKSKIFVRRVGADGSVRGRRTAKVYPDKGGRLVQAISPVLGCAVGRCLVAWNEADGERNEHGKFVDKAYALVLEGDTPIERAATRIMNDVDFLVSVASDGTDFAIAAGRFGFCAAGGGIGSREALFGRVTSAGVPLDLDGIRVDNPTAACAASTAHGLVHAAPNYVQIFIVPGPPQDGGADSYLFAARIAPDGTVLDAEPDGLLLHEEAHVDFGAIAASTLESTAVWVERRITPTGSIFLTVEDDLRTRRVLPRAATPPYPAATIGSIGPQVVAEREALVLTVQAPAGLDPGTTTLSASDLPPGAIFDAPTGAFRWQPEGADAGSHPGPTFRATDATQEVSETVPIDVVEANLGFTGQVRLANGTPVTDVGVKISGIRKDKRVAYTDRDGRYRVEDLGPKRYRVKLSRASRKQYRHVAGAVKVTVETTDAVAPDLIIEPK